MDNRSASAVDTNRETVANVPWTFLDRDELVDAYWAVVAPKLEADGFDPRCEQPTHNWLRENDFRPLLYTLREFHDRHSVSSGRKISDSESFPQTDSAPERQRYVE